MSLLGRGLKLLGFLLMLAGVLTLVASQKGPVLAEATTTEDLAIDKSFVGDGTGVILCMLMVTAGAILFLGVRSTAPAIPRAIALASLGLSLPALLWLQTRLIVNAQGLDAGGYRIVRFSASYFFHNGESLMIPVVYVLFFVTFVLLMVVLGSVFYLMAPTRFVGALLDRRSWAKTEAVHIAATLLLLASLALLFYAYLQLANGADPEGIHGRGLLAENLVTIYYLLCGLFALLALVIAAHAFLLNWGTQLLSEYRVLLDNLGTIARVERALLGAALLFNLLILISPGLPTRYNMSDSFVVDIEPRGFAWIANLLLIPFLPYAISQHRLAAYLRERQGLVRGVPFTQRALRLVAVQVAGLVLLLTLVNAAGWGALAILMTTSAWTAAVLLVSAVRVQTGSGLPKLVLEPEAGPPLYLVFLGLALTTSFMLWGNGNTFEATFQPGNANALQVENESDYGLEQLSRIAAVALLVGSLVLTLDLWLRSNRIRRALAFHYVIIFVMTSLAALFAFTVGVWSKSAVPGEEDAYAGFRFHELYGFDAFLVGLFVAATGAYLYYALGRILRPAPEAPLPVPVTAVEVQWK